MSSSSRIIKNTGLLYLRMGITVFISLYSTRLILASLGEVDFGIFNVIGGSIAMMGFLNSTLTNATQRFLSYAEGKGDLSVQVKIFNISLILQIFIGVVTMVLLLGIMPLLFDKFLNLPPEKEWSAKIVYYTFVFSTFLTIINVPYDATLNAHENMLYYTLIGLLESGLKLAIAIVCVYIDTDKLILYSVLMASLPIITLTIMKIYCHSHYKECQIDIRKYWDINIVKKIASFSGWNFLTAISSLFTVQGLSVVLNHFFGSKLNAAQGIANQVNGQLSAFSTTMMKAINPVIVKKTANGSVESLSNVTFAGCKFSALITLLFAVPFIFKMKYILSTWLEDVPEWTMIFCQLQLIQTVIIQISNPIATAIYGNGDIRDYALYKSIMNILPLLMTIMAFFIGASPIWLYISLIVFMGIGGNIVILYYSKKMCEMSPLSYMKDVVIPVVATSIIMILCGFTDVVLFPEENLVSLILCCIFTSAGMMLSLSTIGLSKEEKIICISQFKKISSKIFRGNN